MITLQQVELGVLGPLQVRQYGLPVTIPGAKPRAILSMLGLRGGSIVPADVLLELLWGDDPPRTAAKAMQTHISSLRRALGDGFILTEGTGWTLCTTEIDALRYESAIGRGRDAIAAGDTSQAVACFDGALTLWRGVPELPDGPRGVSEKTRWLEGHAALVEDRADALLATGRAAEIIGELEAAVADAPLRERRWGQLMLALYRAGRQGEALGAYRRARSLLADELGVDPGPELRRLDAAIVAQDAALEIPVSPQLSVITRAVTFLLTDIEGSTAAWEADAAAMAVALARHDEIVEQVVTSRGGRLVKTRGEGDASFSVFDRPSAAAAAAIEMQEAIRHEPWALTEPMRIRIALHTGEVELRDGDYFGRAVNRAARLRSLAVGGQILCSGASAELVIDTLPDDVVLADLGTRQLRNLARPEHVFELRLESTQSDAAATEDPLERPDLPAVLAGSGPFVGRSRELSGLLSSWQTALGTGTRVLLISGEPGVGKTRLAGEWSRQAYETGAVVLYGRCDEDLGAPYQPFAEALRLLVPCVGASRLRRLRGVEALLSLAPLLTDVLPDLATAPRADTDTERYALFDAVAGLLSIVSAEAPVVLILDDLHWAAKPTLLLLRHLLRFGEHARVQIVGTYRSTDLDRSHPLAAMLADLHRDGSADRLALSGLNEDDISAYVAEAGYGDEELARALASVTGGNPFFLIEALRHVDESGGHWDPSTLPQGVREAVSRRLSRLPAESNKALAAAAVVGSRFALDLVERVVGDDLVDAFDDACKAGIVLEEPGGRYRFNHALVRQSLLAELASVRRMRLHQRIATTLEADQGADDELLAELAYHYFECAWAGNAAKAVEYCRRAADQAMARLAYEGAADFYDKALHALDELDEELPGRHDQQADLLVARCEALLTAGDVMTARDAVAQLHELGTGSDRLAAWGACFDGELSMLTEPGRLDDIASAVAAAAEKLAELEDAAGEAKAHTVRAGCLARLGRIGDCETALDQALNAARRAQEHRRVNAVLANAPLAALWGPSPVPRAGGRCLDVVRLLRITTGSPVVEATSTRCQGVLDAFRGRAAAGRQLIDSARRSLTELGMRHALLEVDQFAGIVELVSGQPAAAEPHLRRAYDGFRRMGLDADTADTAALLARAYLALDRNDEADELCTQSERLAGHALKPAIAWRIVRAQLLARRGDHNEARRVAAEAVGIAERTDALVDHGDACLALATVLQAAGDAAGASAAAEQAVQLYERKGAVALAERARTILGLPEASDTGTAPKVPSVEPDNACVRAVRRLDAAYDREAWQEVQRQVAGVVSCESRRKIVGLDPVEMPYGEWECEARRFRDTLGPARYRHLVVAVRGERLALTRVEVGTADVSPGAPQDELLQLYGLDREGRIALLMWFDLDDMDDAVAELDAAYARFEDRHLRTRRLENAASRVEDWGYALFADGRTDEITTIYAEDIRVDDRRRGLRHETTDRATAIGNVQAIAALSVNITHTPLALRGDRLCLSRIVFRPPEARPDAFNVETVELTEIDTDGLMVARVVFDPDDTDAAFAELDARYAAEEAAAYSAVWSIIVDGYAALNRHEIPTTSPNYVNVDHRRVPRFAAGDVKAYTHASWIQIPDITFRIEAVHRLSSQGAVITQALRGTSQEGFEAEWREIHLMTVDGELFNRSEFFDEADLDAAIARFEQLSRPTWRLKNLTSQVNDRFDACFAARDWDAMAETLTDDTAIDDRRRVVNVGIRPGRDAEVASMRAIAGIGVTNVTSIVIATRGQRLALSRTHYAGRDQSPEAFRAEILDIVEIDPSNRISTRVAFEADDFDAAIAELDARYLRGEAAPYSRAWSVVAEAYAGFNRRKLSETMPDWVNVDHRRGAAFASGDMIAYIQAAWDDSPDTKIHIAAVHRLTNLGAVVTHVAHGISESGFDAEWRDINLVAVDGDKVSQSELFGETDLDAALVRFDELTRPVRHPENNASRLSEKLNATFTARDWAGMTDLLAADFRGYDHRQEVIVDLDGPEAVVETFRAVAELDVPYAMSVVLATRGKCLALTRVRYAHSDDDHDAHQVRLLQIVEIDGDERIASLVTFDSEDIDSAFAELDARYLAGEAAEYAQTWSVIVNSFDSVNKHELPEVTADWANIDHRPGTAFAPGDLIAFLTAAWGDTSDIHIYIEAVHRLSDTGAVLTSVTRGTSSDGFEAEWHGTSLLTIEGGLISRCELFDGTDLDAALTRFDELSCPASYLRNAASRVCAHFRAAFTARDWDAVAAMLADDLYNEDRRRVVNAGIRHGRDSALADMRAAAAIGVPHFTATEIASRGERLVLVRGGAPYDGRPGAFQTDVLQIAEIDVDERIAALVMFDPDDSDAAFAELDARWIASGDVAHPEVIEATRGLFSVTNRHDWDALAIREADAKHVNHRQLALGDDTIVDHWSSIRAMASLIPDMRVELAEILTHSAIGVVITIVVKGTTTEGTTIELPAIVVILFDGVRVTRMEAFDADQRDLALTRFGELDKPAEPDPLLPPPRRMGGPSPSGRD